MRFNPLTDEQIEEARKNLSAGIYKFKVSEAFRGTSKAGNEMIEIKLKITETQGIEHTITDWLLSKDNMIWKLKHFCETTQMMNEYQQGKLEDFQLVGKEGKVKIKMRKKEDRDFPVVEDYIANESENEPFFNDDVPF